MSGFKNSLLNTFANIGTYQLLLEGIIKCCSIMVSDYEKSESKLPNNENKIRNCLFEKYLTNSKNSTEIFNSCFIFDKEIDENYNEETYDYQGRIDIRVKTNDFFKNKNAYYIIECKRLDGGSKLNKKYITEGVCRFLPTDKPAKYSSYYDKNIMLAFVVKKINFENNIKILNGVHSELIPTSNDGISTIHTFHNGKCFLCKCDYLLDRKMLVLNHIFHDFSSVVL